MFYTHIILSCIILKLFTWPRAANTFLESRMLASPRLHRRMSHDGDRLSGNFLEPSDPDLVKTWTKGYPHNISTCTGMGCQESQKYPDGNLKSPQRSMSQVYNHYDTIFGGLSLLNFYAYRYSTPFIWIRQNTDTDNHLSSAGPQAGSSTCTVLRTVIRQLSQQASATASRSPEVVTRLYWNGL
jgi:hypothetical protein